MEVIVCGKPGSDLFMNVNTGFLYDAVELRLTCPVVTSVFSVFLLFFCFFVVVVVVVVIFFWSCRLDAIIIVGY